MKPIIRIGLTLAIIGFPISFVNGETQEAAHYTQAQAEAGETAYQVECAGCHMSDFSGAFEAPELAGANFLNIWGERGVNDLLEYVRATIPP